MAHQRRAKKNNDYETYRHFHIHCTAQQLFGHPFSACTSGEENFHRELQVPILILFLLKIFLRECDILPKYS